MTAAASGAGELSFSNHSDALHSMRGTVRACARRIPTCLARIQTPFQNICPQLWLVYLLWRNIFPEQLTSLVFGKYTEHMKYGQKAQAKRHAYIGDELMQECKRVLAQEPDAH